jgi:hypothetical protein
MAAPSSPKPSKVCFAEGDVTGELRPLTNDEHWTLYYFENHAAKCRSCHDPLRVSRCSRRLCDNGHELAIDVIGLIFRGSDGKIYSRQESHRAIRVEIPGDYVETVSLLKAIQRAVKKGKHFVKPKSHDKSYYVPDRRLPERFATTPEPAQRYETRVAEPWSEHQFFYPRYDDLLWSFPQSHRGSHFDADNGELEKAMKREQRIAYNVELRVPSSRHSSFHG